MFLQAGKRSEAGRITFAFFEKAAPRARQLQQADRVSGRCGIEDDVLVVGSQARIHQKRSELIEGRDLGGAGTGKLFLDATHHVIRQQSAHRADNTVPVGLSSCLRIDFQRSEPRHGGNWRDPVANFDPENLAHIGSRIGAHQQHTVPLRGEFNCRCAGNRRFTDTTLAGEKKKVRRLFEEFHGRLPRRSQQHLLPLQQPPLGASAWTTRTPNQRASSLRLG